MLVSLTVTKNGPFASEWHVVLLYNNTSHWTLISNVFSICCLKYQPLQYKPDMFMVSSDASRKRLLTSCILFQFTHLPLQAKVCHTETLPNSFINHVSSYVLVKVLRKHFDNNSSQFHKLCENSKQKYKPRKNSWNTSLCLLAGSSRFNNILCKTKYFLYGSNVQIQMCL